VAIFIASRCHGFHKSQGEIAKLFRISGDTLTRRVIDFRATPAAQLTVEQFHLNDFDVEYDPPSFIRGQIATAGEDGVSLLLIGGKEGDSDETIDSEDDEDGEHFMDGVKTKKVLIGGIEVRVPLPGQKKPRLVSVGNANALLLNLIKVIEFIFYVLNQ
jgi:hypothetical protein